MRPGSNFYVVWTRQQEDPSNPGVFSPGRDVRAMLGKEQRTADDEESEHHESCSRRQEAGLRLTFMLCAVVHPCDAVSLSSALDARAAGLIEPVLVGPRDRLLEVAVQNKLDLGGVEIEDAPHSQAAAARAVELALAGAGGSAAVPVTLALVFGGLGVAALSLAIGKGWRSVGMSRLADALEGLATARALPLALVAAGAVEAFRALGG